MSNNLIKAENIKKTYKFLAEEIYAVNGIDLEVNAGDYISIMGPSGSGKTTLLDLVGCLDSLSDGRLYIQGRDVSKLKENKLVDIRRGLLGFIFQEFLLIPTLTALENVELGLILARKPKERERAIKILERLGLGQRLHHLPREMSGGEKQRVAIARALVVSPQVLLADEPTGNLDTKSAQDIFDVFDQLNKKDGLTIIVATHNPKLGSQAKRTVYLKDGRIIPKEESSLYSVS